MLREGFPYTVYMVALYDVISQFWYHGRPFKFGFYIFQFMFSGIALGYSVWGEQERKYKEALNSPPQTSVQPH